MDAFVEWGEGEDEGGGIGPEIEGEGDVGWGHGPGDDQVEADDQVESDVEGDEQLGDEEGESDEEEQAEPQDDPGPQTPDIPMLAPEPTAPAAKRRRRRRGRRMWRAARRLGKRAVKAGVFLPYTSTRLALRAAAPLVGIGDDPGPELGEDVTFDLYKTGQGWSGIFRIPLAPGRALLTASTPSPTPTRAAAKAVNLARFATKSPLVKTLAPPQARLALAALKHPAMKGLLKKTIRR